MKKSALGIKQNALSIYDYKIKSSKIYYKAILFKFLDNCKY